MKELLHKYMHYSSDSIVMSLHELLHTKKPHVTTTSKKCLWLALETICSREWLIFTQRRVHLIIGRGIETWENMLCSSQSNCRNMLSPYILFQSNPWKYEINHLSNSHMCCYASYHRSPYDSITHLVYTIYIYIYMYIVSIIIFSYFPQTWLSHDLTTL